ncbi:hypothetical protein LLG95_00085 [bacterium]|nr:hypothetical protein [bacterium]
MVPSITSIEEIAARTEKLHAQTAALISATMPIPEPGNADLPIGKTQSTNVPPPSTHQPAPALPDKLKSKLLDVITSRPTFPGSGNLLDSLRADLLTSPP